MRRAIATALALAATLAASAASAQQASSNAEEDQPWMHPKARVRDGVVLGGALAAGLAGASGYPNDPKAIGKDAFYSRSSLLYGWAITPTLMGALTDYLNFGLMGQFSNYQNANWETFGGALGIRVEVFPLWTPIITRVRNLALYAQGGVGFATLHAKAGTYPDADTAQSYLGVGTHYEMSLFKILGGHVAAGPFAQFDSIFSRDFERHDFNVGLRSVWYGGK
jgi:hypothetical protein